MYNFFGKKRNEKSFKNRFCKNSPKKEVSSKNQFYNNSPKKEVSSRCQCHYTSKIFYIPLFICLIIFFIINIVGAVIIATENKEYKDNFSRRLSLKEI